MKASKRTKRLASKLLRRTERKPLLKMLAKLPLNPNQNQRIPTSPTQIILRSKQQRSSKALVSRKLVLLTKAPKRTRSGRVLHN